MLVFGKAGAPVGLALLILAISCLLAIPMAGQSGREAKGARLLKDAIDMHLHVDAPYADGTHEQATLATVRIARNRGMRALLLKNHWEPTATLTYHFRLEVPGIQLFGGIVMNRTMGGMNPAAVEYMATNIQGAPGKVVWMPAYDSEIESNPPYPKKPFVAVSRSGQLLPEVKEVIAVVAKNHLTLASGHIAPQEALMVFREAGSQGVQHMIATHAMDLAGKMNMDQILQAVKLGAIIEFDFRNVLKDDGLQAKAIRKIGPEHCLISEFWTKNDSPRVYANLEGVGAFAEAMQGLGFSEKELDTMFKDNPARLLGLPAH